MQFVLILRITIRVVVVVMNLISLARKRMNGGISNAMFDSKAKNYAELRGMIDTGDLILFSGKGLTSAIIRWFSGSRWSHIGMVVKVNDGDIVLLFESTTLSKIKDFASGNLRRGVQLVSLSDRLAAYDGKLGVVFLMAKRTPEMIRALGEFRAEMRDKPYEKHFLSLVKSAYDGLLGKNKEDLTSVFCSELVAEAYQRMGVFSDEIPSSEFTPADFDINENKNAHKLPFINGCSITSVVPISMKGV